MLDILQPVRHYVRHMARTSSKPLVEQVVPGLDDQLRSWRRQGLSWETMAKKLVPLGVDVTGRTVSRWYAEIFQGVAS